LDITNISDICLGDLYAVHVCCTLIACCGKLSIISTAVDVIHSIALPYVLLRVDTCPGRLSNINMVVDIPGIYIGQCSELCGALHGFMAIAILIQLFISDYIGILI
jgi:cytochrome c oxidase subunit 2